MLQRDRDPKDRQPVDKVVGAIERIHNPSIGAGVGRFTVEAIGIRDFPVVQASVFLLALIFVLVNLAVDVLYTSLDPRIRYR